jgi:phosphate transport system permease protein
VNSTPRDPVPEVAAAPGGAGHQPLAAHRSSGVGDMVLKLVCQCASLLVIAIVVLLVAVLIWKSWLSLQTTGTSFITTSKWDPEPTHRKFGALPFIYGTTVTSIIAMLIAVPLGVGSATFLSEIAPPWLQRTVSYFIEMLAAIPSVVYGFWGLYVFAPYLRRLINALGGRDQSGVGLLPAGLVLAIMIVPYIAAVSYEVIRVVPRSLREAAIALGATRWQTIWSVVLLWARPGIIGGCFLALGRALGETMAVTMLIGNRPDIVLSIFAKGNSIPSVIANEFTEATYDLYLSALVELGLVLLLVSAGFSALGRVLIWQVSQFASGRFKRYRLLRAFPFRGKGGRQVDPSQSADATAEKGRASPRIPSVNRRAAWSNRLMTGGSPTAVKTGLIALALFSVLLAATAHLASDLGVATALVAGISIAAGLTIVATMGLLGLCQTITVVPLFLILGYLLYRGATALNLNLFVKLPVAVGQTDGGMANAFYGSCLMIALATALSAPIGLLTAIYLAEYRSGRFGKGVRFITEMLGSVPSIVIGIFGYYAVVKPITRNFSGLAGSFALSVMMLPVVIRASEEAFKLVPTSLRDASYALGASRCQTILRVSVPAALPAIITAIFLSISRVAGETAPLLLTASSNAFWPRSLNDYTPSLPVFIFNYAVSPYEEWHRQAWAAAFVLVSAIMVLNVGIRLLAGRRVMRASHVE